MRTKLFAGAKIRDAREARGWTLETAAGQLGLSVSYLSQIETNQRPLTQRVLLALVETFSLDAEAFDAGDADRRLADLQEACATSLPTLDRVPLSEIKRVASMAPRFAHEFLAIHRTLREADERLKLADQAVALGENSAPAMALPYEEVRDFFHYRDNYLHELDTAAEALAHELKAWEGASLESALEVELGAQLGVTVKRVVEDNLVQRIDTAGTVLWLNAAQPSETRAFQMAAHLAGDRLAPLMERVLAQAGFRNPQAAEVCRIALLNYAAGALLMPYGRFAQAARAERHDVERLAQRFGVSFEQVCHRLSTLQRPGQRGIPLYFLRMDGAGNITKRHSATRFHFARFGGTCPLWNVHEAFSLPDRFAVQVAEMPDGARYLSVARSVLKPSGSFSAPSRRYVLGFGCELRHARHLVYVDAVDLAGPATPIGVSCRICPRADCAQRAFPPLDRPIRVSRSERGVVPFAVDEVIGIA